MSRRNVRHAAILAVAVIVVAAEAGAQSAADRIQIHAYMSQAAAGTSDSLPILGIRKDMTTDYRRASLQFRFAATENDNIVLQVRHRRLGTSILPAAEGSLSIDWAFYQRSFGDVNVQAGKIPMPRGIYNQIRDVGVLQPFYRAPFFLYTESFETVDGVNVKATRSLGRGWSTDASAYFGEVPLLFQAGSNLINTRGDRSTGAQLWINTPVQGLRVGQNVMRFTLRDGEPFTGKPGTAGGVSWVSSLDGNFNRVLLRAENSYFDGGDDPYGSPDPAFSYRSYYVQAGVKPHEKLGFYYQVNHARVRVPAPGALYQALGMSKIEYDYAHDVAASVKWDAIPGVSLKAEGHQNTGFNYDVTLSPIGPTGQVAKGLKNKYFIASVAVAF